MPTQDLMDAIRGLKIPEPQADRGRREGDRVQAGKRGRQSRRAIRDDRHSLGMTAKQLMAAARKARREKDEEVM